MKRKVIVTGIFSIMLMLAPGCGTLMSQPDESTPDSYVSDSSESVPKKETQTSEAEKEGPENLFYERAEAINKMR